MVKKKREPVVTDADLLRRWLDRAHELRRAMHGAEVEFMLHLIDGERSGAVPWRGAFDSFAGLLTEQALASPGRYEAFRDALPVVTEKRARTIGVDATIICARQPDKAVEVTISAMEAWVRAHHHEPSRQAAKSIAKDIAPVVRMPRDLGRELKQEDLRRENQALRRELAAARARIAELEAELRRVGRAVPPRRPEPWGPEARPST